MHFRAVTTVGLEGTLGHRSVLIRDSLPCGQVLSIADQAKANSPVRPSATSRACRCRTLAAPQSRARSHKHAMDHALARRC
jgi:hypothetical protein